MTYRALIVAVILSFLGSATISFAIDESYSPPTEKGKELTVQKVYDIPGVDQAKIYDRSKIWMATNFKSSKQAIEFESRELGIIMGNGNVPYVSKSSFGKFMTSKWKILFVMKEEIKDNKIRITFEKLRLNTAGMISSDKDKETPFEDKGDLPGVTPSLLALSDKLAEDIAKSTGDDKW